MPIASGEPTVLFTRHQVLQRAGDLQQVLWRDKGAFRQGEYPGLPGPTGPGQVLQRAYSAIPGDKPSEAGQRIQPVHREDPSPT